MTSDKKSISLLADIFVKSGLSDIVISPGSRNAPVILSFVNRKEINAFNIVDERSAAFFALGLALSKKKTVAIACTSGSAVLNYASAISEAYYQKIPLLVLTADRPSHMIDIGDGQTIRQKEVFRNFIRESYELPLDIAGEESKDKLENLINEAINNCVFPQAGPVHINIPFDEPLYNTTDEQISGKLITFDKRLPGISDRKIREISDGWNKSKKVMIIAGQTAVNKKIKYGLEKISKNSNTVILTETTSNVYGVNNIDCIDNVVSGIREEETESFKPEILISLGGQVVSKLIKNFLRKHPPSVHWHISPAGEKMDTYFSLTECIRMDGSVFLDVLSDKLHTVKSDYSTLWQSRKKKIESRKQNFLKTAEYSDLKVFESILNHLPANSVLHLGNSTPVRYSQLFGSRDDIIYISNRGVSGIDGQVSTAAGYAFGSDKLNVMISGDLGFLYDSNALMNHYLKPNFKIIVINNSGGGIFRFIPGPDTTPNLEEFFEAKHQWDARHIAMTYGLEYRRADTLKQLESELPDFFMTDHDRGPSVIEIFTPAEKNAEILRAYFKHIRLFDE